MGDHKYQQYFCSSPAIMFVASTESGSIIDANLAALDYYGWSLSELRQKKIWDISTEHSAEVANRISQAIKGSCTHFRAVHRTSSGREQDVEVYTGPVLVDDTLRIIGVVQPVKIPKTTRQVPPSIRKEDIQLLLTVSKREKEVLALVGLGITTKEIAEKLHIAVRTVDAHRSSLMRKLSATNAASLSRWAIVSATYTASL